jgi:hypothetical protein
VVQTLHAFREYDSKFSRAETHWRALYPESMIAVVARAIDAMLRTHPEVGEYNKTI